MKNILIYIFVLIGCSATSQDIIFLNSEFAQQQETPPASTLYDNDVVWFDCNDASAPITDASGNGFDASVYDLTAYQQTGHVGYSLQFDGTDDRLVVSDNDSLSFQSSGMTLAIWVYIQAYSDNQTLFNKYHEYDLFITTSGQLRFRKWGTSSTYTGRQTDVSIISTGTWYLVIATDTGSSSRDDTDLYVYDTNGDLVGGDTSDYGTSSGGIGYSNQSSDLWLGVLSGTGDAFNGFMSQIIAWRKVLSSPEIAEFVNNGDGGANGDY